MDNIVQKHILQIPLMWKVVHVTFTVEKQNKIEWKKRGEGENKNNQFIIRPLCSRKKCLLMQYAHC